MSYGIMVLRIGVHWRPNVLVSGADRRPLHLKLAGSLLFNSAEFFSYEVQEQWLQMA